MTTTSGAHGAAIPLACQAPAGAGTGPFVDADVVELANTPRSPGTPGVAGGTSITEWVRVHPQTTAGLFVSGSHVWVGFTRDAEGGLASLRRDTGQGSGVRAFRATYTESELRALQDRISADSLQLRKLGILISVLAFDIYTNRLQVMLTHVDDRACALLTQRYGSGRFYLTEGVAEPVAARG